MLGRELIIYVEVQGDEGDGEEGLQRIRIIEEQDKGREDIEGQIRMFKFKIFFLGWLLSKYIKIGREKVIEDIEQGREGEVIVIVDRREQRCIEEGLKDKEDSDLMINIIKI